jgi:DNA modification methylase
MQGKNDFEVNSIFNEDCFETMKHMPKFVDVILTSPPYNTSRNTNSDRARKEHEGRYDIYLDNKTDEEYLDWSQLLFKSYDRILKTNGTILYNLSYSSENTDLIWKFVGEIIRNTNFTTADTIVWKKDTALPNNTTSNKLTRICEFVFVFVRKSEIDTFVMNKAVTSQNEKGQNYYENLYNFIDAKNNDKTNSLNKATFSTEFVRKLLRMYAKPNSIIYDSFMGTGTTAEACVMEKMQFIGSELSKSQCDYASKRLNIRISQPTLF